MTDEEVICTWMEPKPDGRAKRGASKGLWWIRVRGVRWFPSVLTLDRLWEVEDRLIHQGRADEYRYSLVHRDAYFFHATAAQKIKALAAVLRPEVERG